MSPRPGWLVIAETQARELGRRRTALGLLFGVPLVWYLAELASGANWAVASAAMGIGWGAGAASLFAFLGARRVDARLVQAGYRPREIVLGRVATLLGISMTLAGLFGALVVATDWPDRPGIAVLSMVLAAVVGVPLGWTVAAIVPRELEGFLLLIGVIGIESSLPASAPGAVMPLWAALRLMDPDQPAIGGLVPTLQALVYAAALGAVALYLWSRRVRLQPATLEVTGFPGAAPVVGEISGTR